MRNSRIFKLFLSMVIVMSVMILNGEKTVVSGFATSRGGEVGAMGISGWSAKELYLKAMGVRGDLAKKFSDAKTDEERKKLLQAMGFNDKEIEKILSLDSEYAESKFLKEHGFSDKEIKNFMAKSDEEQRAYLKEEGIEDKKIDDFTELSREDSMEEFIADSEKSDLVEQQGQEPDVASDTEETTTEEFNEMIEEDGLTTYLHVVVTRDEHGKIIERHQEGWEEGTADDGHEYYKEIESSMTYTYDSFNRVIEQTVESWDSDTDTTTNTTIYKEYNNEDYPTHASNVRTETEDSDGNLTVTEKSNIKYDGNGQMVKWHEETENDGDDITVQKDVTVEYNEKGQIVKRYEEGHEEGVDDDGKEYSRDFDRTIEIEYDNLGRMAKQEIESWDSESDQTVNITKTYKYENEDHPSLASEVYTKMCTQGYCGWKREYNIVYEEGEKEEWDEKKGGDLKF